MVRGIKNIGLQFVIIMLIAILIGLLIVKTVDHKLQDISISMPTIKLPRQKITLRLNKKKDKLVEEKSKLKSEQTAGNTADNTICRKDLKPPGRHFIKHEYHSDTGKREHNPQGIVPEPSSDHNERPAPIGCHNPELDRDHPISGIGTGTYYLDPNDMTPAQIEKFKYKAKFYKMTTNDYTNWLLLFSDDPQELSAFHRSNLRILKRGGTLSDSDMPRSTPLPPNSQQQYLRKISHGEMQNIPQPEYLGYLPSNFDEQVGPKPKKNRDLRHLDFINPDEPLKTWILTHKRKALHDKVHEIPFNHSNDVKVPTIDSREKQLKNK